MIWLKAAVITLGIGVVILIGVLIAAIAWPLTIMAIIFFIVMMVLKGKPSSE